MCRSRLRSFGGKTFNDEWFGSHISGLIMSTTYNISRSHVAWKTDQNFVGRLTSRRNTSNEALVTAVFFNPALDQPLQKALNEVCDFMSSVFEFGSDAVANQHGIESRGFQAEQFCRST